MPEHYIARAHQQIGTQHLLDHKRCMLVADPGLGKTSMGLSALDLLMLAGSNYFPALVIAPKRVADVVWTGEQRKWDAFQGLSIIQIVGSPEERLSILRSPKHDIYVINYDLLPWLLSIFPAERWPFKIVLCDESSKLKGFRLNKGTVRSTALSNIAKFTGRWWNFTGTPCPNGLMDLWGQMWFVDYGLSLGRTYTDFMSTFFLEDRYTKKISMQLGAEKEIHSRVADSMLALRAEDWLDIKKPQFIPVEFQLPLAARQQYREMERDYFTTVTDRQIAIEAGTGATKSFKMLQMCSGSVYDEFGTPHPVHDEKIEALKDVVEMNGGEPLLVAYWWHYDPERILKAFPDAVLYAGQETEDLWNAGKIKMLLLHMQSAHGLNLHMVCRDVCFYSYIWNAELRTQMIGRVGPVRQEQAGFKRVVRVWDIQAADTVEGDVIDSNDYKISIEDALKRARARRKNG